MTGVERSDPSLGSREALTRENMHSGRSATVQTRSPEALQRPAETGCEHCGVTATSVRTDFGPFWLGHNTRRVCKRCGHRWCSEYPRESWGVLWSFCSPRCKRAWFSGKRRECVVCHSPIPASRRADARTCSGACRVALYRSKH